MNDKKSRHIELTILIILLVLLFAGVVNSAVNARKEKRDSIRRAEIRKIKHRLEMYYNKHNHYPLELEDGKYEYVVTDKNEKGATGWYVSGHLENKPKPTAAIDREYNVEWRTTQEGEYHICGGNQSCL